MKKYYEKSKKAYDKKAINYDKTVAGRFTKPMKHILFEKIQIKEKDRVLDVACGNGWFLANLMKKNNIEAHGIDISSKMIEIASNTYPNINFKIGTSNKLDYKDNFFDIITVNAAFHHFPEPDKFIKEVKRCLKKGGKIYITEIYVLPGIRHILNLFMPISKNGDYRLYAPKDIVKLYEKYGLKDIKVYKKNYTEIIVATK